MYGVYFKRCSWSIHFPVNVQHRVPVCPSQRKTAYYNYYNDPVMLTDMLIDWLINWSLDWFIEHQVIKHTKTQGEGISLKNLTRRLNSIVVPEIFTRRILPHAIIIPAHFRSSFCCIGFQPFFCWCPVSDLCSCVISKIQQ